MNSTHAARCARDAQPPIEKVGTSTVAVSQRTASATCVSPADVIAYAQDDWIGLAETFAVAPEGCLEVWISVPTEPGADGAWLTTRKGMKQRFAKIGANVHPMPEVNFNAWNKWGESHPDVSWIERGKRARREMEQAGYDFGKGDRWALNENPYTLLTDPEARVATRDFVVGLHAGSSQPAGVIYSVMHPQNIPHGAQLVNELREWFKQESFWKVMAEATLYWSEEAYADIRSTCQSGASSAEQITVLRGYAFHREAIAKAIATSSQSPLRKVMSRGVPLINGAWAWADAYGFTAVPIGVMDRFIGLQVSAAARKLEGQDFLTVGFAWAPKRPDGMSQKRFSKDLGTLVTSIRDQAIEANRVGTRSTPKPCSWPGAKLQPW